MNLKHYPHAPIIEAVISIGCELPTAKTLVGLRGIHEAIKSDYPKLAERVQLNFQVQLAEAKATFNPREVNGYQLVSEDGKRSVILELNGFAFSQLAPYDRWETFSAEARRMWDVFASMLHPTRIGRVGVRFINRIDIPAPEGKEVDLDTYLNTAPNVPAELPQTIETFFNRWQLVFQNDPKGTLVLMQTNVLPPQPGFVSTLLDLDFTLRGLDADITTAWIEIERLRDRKNAAFEACIKDTARELFK
jgi:uncharacterized protein (TIGR04255 family)